MAGTFLFLALESWEVPRGKTKREQDHLGVVWGKNVSRRNFQGLSNGGKKVLAEVERIWETRGSESASTREQSISSIGPSDHRK